MDRRKKIYTKTGDKGSTSLFGGKRVTKIDPRIEAVGLLDEFNAYLGLCHNLMGEEQKNEMDIIVEIMSRVFDVSSYISTPPDAKEDIKKMVEFSKENIQYLEERIDHYDNPLPPITNFVLPTGSLLFCQLNIARTKCRTAERKICEVYRSNIPGEFDQNIVKYINRLSDFLFVLARYENYTNRNSNDYKPGKEEILYSKNKHL